MGIDGAAKGASWDSDELWLGDRCWAGRGSRVAAMSVLSYQHRSIRATTAKQTFVILAIGGAKMVAIQVRRDVATAARLTALIHASLPLV